MPWGDEALSVSTVLLILIGLSVFAFVAGRRRSYAVAEASGGIRSLHSLPGHYGLYTALWCGVPAILLLFAWKVAEPNVITGMVVKDLPVEIRDQEPARLGLFMNDVKNLVAGNVVTGQASEEVRVAADRYLSLQQRSAWMRTILAGALAILGLILGYRYVHPDLRARNRVESVIPGLLRALTKMNASDLSPSILTR